MVEYACGFDDCPAFCPSCGKADITMLDAENYALEYEIKKYLCLNCNFEWNEIWMFDSWEPAEINPTEDNST